jgi:hypothetical protein
VGKHHADHLRDALLQSYELTTDWEGKVYSGISLKWDYKNRTCYMSIPGNVSNVFQHNAPKHPQHTPSKYVTPVYGTKTQYATQYETPPLTAKQCLNIQKVTRSVLYYARAVGPTVLMPLNDIATEQTKATEKTQAAKNQLLDYLATHPYTTIRYHASDMILHIHSDASYLSVSNARSRLGGLFFCGDKPPQEDTLNGSILNAASVIKNLVAPVAESEVGLCFQNAQSGAPLRVTLTELERKVDTLEFFPHNSPMPQLSSTDRLIMATNDMANALQHPHPEVPFAHVGDDTITALTQLAEIFKNKFQKPKSPELTLSPTKAAENKRPVALTQPLLTSPMQHMYQTRSQTPILKRTTSNTTLLPRLVTPMTSRAASPRVPARTQNLSPRNLSQDDFWSMETANMAIALVTNNWSQQHSANAVVHPVTGK